MKISISSFISQGPEHKNSNVRRGSCEILPIVVSVGRLLAWAGRESGTEKLGTEIWLSNQSGVTFIVQLKTKYLSLLTSILLLDKHYCSPNDP